MQNNFNHKPKIIMVGMPDMANVCLNELIKNSFNVIGLIPPHHTNSSRNSIINFAKLQNVPVYEFQNSPNEEEFVSTINSLQADLGIIASFDFKLSKEFLNTARDGYINCHPSLLPHYRGANPYFHIIKNGDKLSGLTLHMADENFDTGDIVAQETIYLDSKETMGTLFNRTNFLLANMLVKILKKYEKEGRIQSAPQLGESNKKAPKVPFDIKINWADDVVTIERTIRASNPFFNCYTIFRDTTFKIISADYKLKKQKENFGVITNITKDRIEISAKNGYLYPKIIQIGSWGVYDTKEFIEKFKPTVGETLR